MDDKVKIEYSNASYKQRWGIYLVDLFFIFFVTFVFFSLNMMVNKEIPAFNKYNKQQESLKVDSNLYEEDGTFVIDYVNDENIFYSYEDKKDYLSKTIENFYLNTDFFASSYEYESYQQRQLDSVDNGIHLFERDSSNKIVETSLKPEVFYNFYVDEIENKCISYLYNNVNYANASRMIFIISISSFVLDLLVSYIIFKVIIPLTLFKKGRQTLGMKIFKAGYVGINAFNIKKGKYIGYCIFNFFIMYILNFVGFLLPSILSVSMMYFTKTKQGFCEYVFNFYLVSCLDHDIYNDYSEYIDQKDKKKNAKLENKDIILK